MYIRQLSIRNFRGFSDIPLKPSGNVVLMGEPGAGRSDLINAISRILDSGVIRPRGTRLQVLAVCGRPFQENSLSLQE